MDTWLMAALRLQMGFPSKIQRHSQCASVNPRWFSCQKRNPLKPVALSQVASMSYGWGLCGPWDTPFRVGTGQALGGVVGMEKFLDFLLQVMQLIKPLWTQEEGFALLWAHYGVVHLWVSHFPEAWHTKWLPSHPHLLPMQKKKKKKSRIATLWAYDCAYTLSYVGTKVHHCPSTALDQKPLEWKFMMGSAMRD